MLSVDTALGTKVLLVDPIVRRGLLLLRPDNVLVLGGVVNDWEQSKIRALQVWSEPVVGCPPGYNADLHTGLLARMRRAAADQSGGRGPGAVERMIPSRPEPHHHHPNAQGTPFAAARDDDNGDDNDDDDNTGDGWDRVDTIGNAQKSREDGREGDTQQRGSEWDHAWDDDDDDDDLNDDHVDDQPATQVLELSPSESSDDADIQLVTN